MHMAGGRWENPYGDGGTSRKIVSVLKGWLEEGRIDLKKKFYDIPWNGDKL